MTDLIEQRSAAPEETPPVAVRKHHWLRWVFVGVATILVLVIAGLYVFVHFLGGATPAPLSLPELHATGEGVGSTSIDGTWTVGNGSLAGYRVREDFLGPGDSVVGRTSGVTGHVLISHSQASSASFRVDLTSLKSNGKPQPQFAGILGTASHPDATLTLTAPIVPISSPAANKEFRAHATGQLAMHGTTHSVTFEITAHSSGPTLEAVGSVPIVFSDWNIKPPTFLQDDGVVEFLLVMHQ
jgi:polyisoprenoid-binding protein YceI